MAHWMNRVLGATPTEIARSAARGALRLAYDGEDR
jgi:AraC family transcriptional regulator